MKNEIHQNKNDDLLSYNELRSGVLYVIVSNDYTNNWFYVKSDDYNIPNVKGIVLNNNTVTICYWPEGERKDVKKFRKALSHEYIKIQNS